MSKYVVMFERRFWRFDAYGYAGKPLLEHPHIYFPEGTKPPIYQVRTCLVDGIGCRSIPCHTHSNPTVIPTWDLFDFALGEGGVTGIAAWDATSCTAARGTDSIPKTFGFVHHGSVKWLECKYWCRGNSLHFRTNPYKVFNIDFDNGLIALLLQTFEDRQVCRETISSAKCLIWLVHRHPRPSTLFFCFNESFIDAKKYQKHQNMIAKNVGHIWFCRGCWLFLLLRCLASRLAIAMIRLWYMSPWQALSEELQPEKPAFEMPMEAALIHDVAHCSIFLRTDEVLFLDLWQGFWDFEGRLKAIRGLIFHISWWFLFLLLFSECKMSAGTLMWNSVRLAEVVDAGGVHGEAFRGGSI